MAKNWYDYPVPYKCEGRCGRMGGSVRPRASGKILCDNCDANKTEYTLVRVRET